MRRRLTILLVDAVVLVGIAGVVMALFRLDTAPLSAAEPRPRAAVVDPLAQPLPPLPAGTVAVSARVVALATAGIIMPGDTVSISRKPGAAPALSNAQVVRIDPPLIPDDDRLHVTFALPLSDAALLRQLREEELLFISLSGIHGAGAHQAFEPMRPQEVITLRYAADDWLKRLSAR